MTRSDCFCRRNPTPRKWDVWLADVCFGDVPGHKKRPVVILGRSGNSYRVLEITSHAVRSCSDIEVIDCFSAGLDRSSTVKCASARILDGRRFTARMGTLGEEDIGALSRRGY